MSESAPRRRIRAQSSPSDGHVMGFVLDTPVQAGRSARFGAPDDGAPLSRALFGIPGVRSVEASDTTIWVRKEDSAGWAVLKLAIAAAIRQVLDETDAPLGALSTSTGSNSDADLLHAVEDLLERQVTAEQLQSTAGLAETAVRYNTVNIDGQDIFYREAGNTDAPTLLLLHGFPTSSQQYRDLIPELADTYHVVAPDYPGFGRSSMPDRGEFDYSFANYADLMDGFTDTLGLTSYSLYVMDYGAPVGYRLALKEPEAIDALIIQNGNAYDEGLLEFWNVFRSYWENPISENREPLRDFLNVGATEWQYTHGVPETHLSRVSPDAWMLDQAYLDRPGNQEIQLDLFYDYRTNVDLYPEFQEFFQTYQPPTLIVWGKNDYIFPAEGAAPYLRDLPRAEFISLTPATSFLSPTGQRLRQRSGPSFRGT